MITTHVNALAIDVFKDSDLQRNLRGTYVYLQPLDEKYREVLRNLAKDERIWEFTKTILVNETYDQQWEQYFNQALRLREEGGLSFIIREVKKGLLIGEEGPIIGMTRLYCVEPEFKRLEIGYTWYVPALWGKAYNRECKLLLLQYAFETLGFNRVGFRVAHQNIRSQKAVAKIGGVKEGVLRKNGIRGDGSYSDTVIFSIINDEWPEKKVSLQQWVTASFSFPNPSAHQAPA